MTAPISNEPTTTRLHHYAGRYSHGSGTPVEIFFAPAWGSGFTVETLFTPARGSSTPVETFFAHAWGSSTPVETFFTHALGCGSTVEMFFAHAHPKWLIFDHFHRAGAIFLSQRHPKLPPGATQGRSFFHAAPRDDTKSPPVWRAPRGMGPGRGARGQDETCPAVVDSGWDQDKTRPTGEKGRLWGVLCVLGEFCPARVPTEPSRACCDLPVGQARDWDERKTAPA